MVRSHGTRLGSKKKKVHNSYCVKVTSTALAARRIAESTMYFTSRVTLFLSCAQSRTYTELRRHMTTWKAMFLYQIFFAQHPIDYVSIFVQG